MPFLLTRAEMSDVSKCKNNDDFNVAKMQYCSKSAYLLKFTFSFDHGESNVSMTHYVLMLVLHNNS
jgi:hypothetical protein